MLRQLLAFSMFATADDVDLYYTTADVISKLVPTGEILSAEKKISEKSKKPKFRSFDRG